MQTVTDARNGHNGEGCWVKVMVCWIEMLEFCDVSFKVGEEVFVCLQVSKEH